MVYCEHCGAANDIMNQQCLRCGHALPQLDQATDSVISSEFVSSGARTKPAAQPRAETDLGSELELPEWLRRAAASTPEIDGAHAPDRNGPPPGFRVASPEPNGKEMNTQSNADNPAPPVRSPEWMKSTQARPAQPAAASAQPASDVTDTSSFISENDLPDWIRQIGVADAAKQVEVDRLAAEAAKAPEEEIRRKLTLPGETPQVGPASNPWLSRKDGPGATSAWSESSVPAPASARSEPRAIESEQPEVVQFDPAHAESTGIAPKKKLSLPAMKLSMPAIPKFTMPSQSDGGSGQVARYALIGAIALLLILILVMVL